MLFDPQTSRNDAETGRSGGDRYTPSAGCRPGPDIGDSHFFVGPLLFCLLLFITALVVIL